MCAIGHKQTSFHIEKSEDGDVINRLFSFTKKLKTSNFFANIWHLHSLVDESQSYV